MNKITIVMKRGGNLGTVPGTTLFISGHIRLSGLPKGGLLMRGVPKLPSNI